MRAPKEMQREQAGRSAIEFRYLITAVSLLSPSFQGGTMLGEELHDHRI
jgi:hypothetical protein